MLGCVWGRAQVSRKYGSLFYKEKAFELVKQIDFAAGESARKAVRQKDASAKMLHEYETASMRPSGIKTYGKQRKRLYKSKEFVVERSDEGLNGIVRAAYIIHPEKMSKMSAQHANSWYDDPTTHLLFTSSGISERGFL